MIKLKMALFTERKAHANPDYACDDYIFSDRNY
jgi:hypothetical protein